MKWTMSFEKGMETKKTSKTEKEPFKAKTNKTQILLGC